MSIRNQSVFTMTKFPNRNCHYSRKYDGCQTTSMYLLTISHQTRSNSLTIHLCSGRSESYRTRRATLLYGLQMIQMIYSIYTHTYTDIYNNINDHKHYYNIFNYSNKTKHTYMLFSSTSYITYLQNDIRSLDRLVHIYMDQKTSDCDETTS